MGLFASNDLDAFYEFDPATTVSDERPHVFYIRRDIAYGVRLEVDNSMIDRTKRDKRGMPELRPERRDYAMLKAFIAKWEGPKLDGVPINESILRQFNWNDPFFQHVLTTIKERYGEGEQADESGGASDESPKAGGVVIDARNGWPPSEQAESSNQLVNTTQSSHW